MPAYKSTRSEARFLKMLRTIFKAPAYAVLAQVPAPILDAESKSRARVIDALAIAACPSRHAGLIGFEMKSDRVSWTSDLKNPKKAADWAQFCDEWYLVASKGVAKQNEVPTNWGFYEERYGELELVKPAQRLTPQEPSRDLFFSLFQAIMHQLHPTPAGEALDLRYAEGRRDGEADARRHFTAALQEIKGPPAQKSPFAELERILSAGSAKDQIDRIKIFEEIARRFTKWRSLWPAEAALEAVDFMSKGGLRSVASKLEGIKDDIFDLGQSVEAHAKSLLKAADDIQPKDDEDKRVGSA